jgi:hypothetical protein
MIDFRSHPSPVETRSLDALNVALPKFLEVHAGLTEQLQSRPQEHAAALAAGSILRGKRSINRLSSALWVA